ncbi:hypothetical protein XENTR_v10018729 [Xenopus tropicalis]|uniref:Cell surface glycoprotein MUC18 isoform X1 n=1 Tax=Xenopus tropicalis TaxID=8364 RepID=F6XJC4_XENTR|nr:cell surface glycoprotein MUC18 isoform X1 [Xenopus tropicalis]KAE8592322.1 hypothetical protein XENTR_v10018729 [Xenopus tropicalis]
MTSLILLSLCLLSWRGALGQPDGVLQVKAKVSETIKLPCSSYKDGESNNKTLEWLSKKTTEKVIYRRGPNGLTVPDPELKERMSVDEHFTLEITDVRVQDEMIFICRVVDTSTKEDAVQLLVFKAPESPEIIMTKTSFRSTDEISEFGSCKSVNGYPLPTITWYKNDLPLKHKQNEVQISSLNTQLSSGLYTVESSLSLPLQKDDDKADIYCEVSYHLPSGDHMMESEKKNITVLYPSKSVRLFRLFPIGPVKEGDDVELKCEGDGTMPLDINYKRKGEELNLGEGPSLILEKVTHSSSGTYECTGMDFENLDESMTDEIELQVHFLDQPEFSQMSPVVVHPGDHLSVSCEANSSVETETLWKHKGHIMAHDSFLTLSEITHAMSGKYICIVTLPSVPGLSVSKELEIIVKGKPELSVSSKSIYVQENNLATVTCKALAHPKPTITWSANGTTSEMMEGPEITSELSFIVTSELLDIGVVVCKATNKMGSSKEEIKLYLSTTPPVSVTTSSDLLTSPAPENNTGSGNTVPSDTKKDVLRGGSHGVLIVVVIICILLLAILGAVLYFLYKKGRIPCGRSGKQDITKPGEKEQIVVEMKPDSPAEESVLLPGAQEKKPPGDQGEKYMDLRN